jgi:DNA-directed RNA polymerase subunit alpha
MGIAWKDFEMPSKVEVEEASYTPTYGKFFAEPLERGYGATIGNALRRVLLSSLEGSAVTSVKFNGVLHEFSSLPGVLQDVPEILLNVKKLVLRSHTRSPKTLVVTADKKGDVTAAKIQTDETVEILNPDLHIATLTKPMEFNLEMEVGIGRGYVPAERNRKESQPLGVIPLDSIFSPVSKVNFMVENTRVGQMTDYDRLILEIWTRGAMNPKEALLTAGHILQKHLEIFTGFGELPAEEGVEEEEILSPDMLDKLRMPVTELELSVRSANCLREAKLKTIAELVQKTEPELLKYRNLGKKSLSEIQNLLKTMDMSLGMKLDRRTLEQVSV